LLHDKSGILVLHRKRATRAALSNV
jgi:hypothetical protein